MSIQILPARLANQIAAGEVVERPASVIKELVENSLDAGASRIEIAIEKGGAKRIRITDNGKGIAKEELTLALSRHATSKIKNLNDLEAISSLGFRGEALASISSVARLTLTSKPPEQENAWQATTEGRDMAVTVQPAAHPDGTTIDVEDLFFNTPARRKFLRTEKTEFSHIEEVLRRIALACFDVTFILKHNHKIVRQYRAITNVSQKSKRVAQICGQKFIDNAIEVDCQHDNLHLWGWLSTPEFIRNQNDLSYSYVNGRMMKDKLINHAIRQAYADLLPRDGYPAFVLFLTLDYNEVDVNVHPAKHEVRFHQGRYVHDFIFSICNKALLNQSSLGNELSSGIIDNNQVLIGAGNSNEMQVNPPSTQGADQQVADYIKPLRQVNEHSTSASSSGYAQPSYSSKAISQQASVNYQKLMTPLNDAMEVAEITPHQSQLSKSNTLESNDLAINKSKKSQLGQGDVLFVASNLFIMTLADTVKLVSVSKLEQSYTKEMIEDRWADGLISQPLLLPVKINVEKIQADFFNSYEKKINQLGIVFTIQRSTSIQIRQFPALLREKDVNNSVLSLLEILLPLSIENKLEDNDFQSAMSSLICQDSYSQEQASLVLNKFSSLNNVNLTEQLLLNSVDLDLTSAVSKLNRL